MNEGMLQPLIPHPMIKKTDLRVPGPLLVVPALGDSAEEED